MIIVIIHLTLLFITFLMGKYKNVMAIRRRIFHIIPVRMAFVDLNNFKTPRRPDD